MSVNPYQFEPEAKTNDIQVHVDLQVSSINEEQDLNEW